MNILKRFYYRLMYGPLVTITYQWRSGFFGIYDDKIYTTRINRDLVGLKEMELALAGFIVCKVE